MYQKVKNNNINLHFRTVWVASSNESMDNKEEVNEKSKKESVVTFVSFYYWQVIGVMFLSVSLSEKYTNTPSVISHSVPSLLPFC